MLEIDQLITSWGQCQLSYHFNVPTYKFIAITGRSGIGKSTLLQMIAGLVPIVSGSVRFNNKEFTYDVSGKRPVDLLFQQDNLFEHLTLRQNIALGITLKPWKTKAQQQQIDEMLAMLHLQSIADRKPMHVSGGEAQRAALGRVLLRKNPILLLDEPFAALDPDLRIELLTLVKELHLKNKLTTLIVSHQPDEVSQFVDEIIEFK